MGSNIDHDKLLEVLNITENVVRHAKLDELLKTSGLSVSIQEFITIAKAVCAVGCGGNPDPSSVCALIDTL